ncbi:MAG: DUF429 domain-containing protein [Bacteroidota bacterium]|nr:DUF429 domain-containing protein [Bacteroidota bacterium]
MNHIGIDGCKAGWFYVSLDDDDNWNMGILSNIKELSAFLPESKLILVDIPIGLRESGLSERLCDMEARRVLTKRKSSIFPAPCRQALSCTTYKDACKVNEKVTGRKISQQTWAISSKIKQMDDFLSETNTAGRVSEFHPEVAFWALNNKTEMQHNKKLQHGHEERLKVLLKYYPFTEEIVCKAKEKYRRKDLALDDIIDAIAGAVTAKYSKSLCTLPQIPEMDNRGLAMEIVYGKL